MQPFAVETDDRAFALARAGEVLSSSPSAVADGSSASAAGADAWASVRRLPTATSTRHLASVLREAQPTPRALSLAVAELVRRLREHPPQAAERVWIAAPAAAQPAGLGALLAIARHLSLPVDGFVDAAVASVAALDIGGAAIVIELGLHHAAATLIEREGGPVRRRRAVISERGGLLALYQAWLELINTALVRQMRFDALHDAASEQQLFDLLPGLAGVAADSGVATAALSSAGRRIELPLTRDQLAHAAQPLWREITQLLHELRPAGSAFTLLAPRSLLALPGWREAMTPFAGCAWVGLPEGFAAAATSLLDLPPRGAAEPVRLLRRLPAAAQPLLAARVVRESAGARGATRPAPSHVLLEGRTFALGSEPLVVGRAPGSAHAITLAEGLAGVSRRHCTLLRDGEQLVLLDHSRFGTFVNGERVAERALVYAGDEVRIGDPGVALALIAVGDGAPAAPA
jgi:hypothetical protein